MALREKAAFAARHILGDECYDGMRKANISLPRILEAAGLQAFYDHLSGVHVEHLRQALKELNSTGVLR